MTCSRTFWAWATTRSRSCAQTAASAEAQALCGSSPSPRSDSTVSTIVVGARDEAQLRQNLGAIGWNLTPEQVAKLDAASATTKAYPYWHQGGWERNPNPV